MSINKTKYSTCKVTNEKGAVICYLSTTDEKNALDVHYDLLGYTVTAI